MRIYMRLLADCSQTHQYEHLVVVADTVVSTGLYVRECIVPFGPSVDLQVRIRRAQRRFLGGERVDDLQDSQRMMREMAQQIRDLIGGRSVPITQRMLELPSQLEQEADVLESEINMRTLNTAN
jgi:hypothetical protein